MQKRWHLAKESIPLDLCEQASNEAQELYDFYGYYKAGIPTKTEPADPEKCPYLNFRLHNTKAIEDFYSVAPTIANILFSYNGIQPPFGRVPTDYFATGITINYAKPGSHVPRHIDRGSINEASYIATLCGRADFIIEDQYKKYYSEFRVNPGDIHIVHNPAEYEERLWHGAQTVGDEPRISLAARLPLL